MEGQLAIRFSAFSLTVFHDRRPEMLMQNIAMARNFHLETSRGLTPEQLDVLNVSWHDYQSDGISAETATRYMTMPSLSAQHLVEAASAFLSYVIHNTIKLSCCPHRLVLFSTPTGFYWKISACCPILPSWRWSTAFRNYRMASVRTAEPHRLVSIYMALSELANHILRLYSLLLYHRTSLGDGPIFMSSCSMFILASTKPGLPPADTIPPTLSPLLADKSMPKVEFCVLMSSR